jgi:CheY-like chemotaxis protein
MALSRRFNIKLFNDTDLALKYINDQEREIQLSGSSDKPKPQGESETWVKQVLTRQHIKRFDQFKVREVSVVVADYSMPAMNGIEFCEKIHNTAVRKILLTGHATSSEAVKAFNNNIIHYYLNKSDVNMLQELETAIHQLQHAYFNEISSSIKAEAIDSGTPFFADSELARYFKNNCETLEVTEYYYLTNPSRFSLQTKSGKEFIVEHLQVLMEEGAPEDICTSIKSRAFVPYFKSADGYYEPGIPNPQTNIHPAEHVKGKVNYYCAVLCDDNTASNNALNLRVGPFH